jgi:tRNA nucleotidyltransferase (CCA-adding enzyme)
MIKAARRIVEKLRLNGYEAFFAGGWVRDFLLRRKPKDIDIATSALPDEILRLFPNARPIGAQFGVIQVLMYGRAYEVATFRSDSKYLDGRHPSSVTFSGPEQDALRRDFTINGLFFDPVADRLIDFVHGSSDIQNKLVRTIGDPYERFSEDKLRMLRAIRFSCNLGFNIAPETWSALRKLAPDILQVSWERIRDELIQILTGPAPGAGLSMLHESGLLIHILPEIEAMRGIPLLPGSPPEADVFAHTRTALSLLRKPSAVLAFGALLHDVGKPSTYEKDARTCFEGHAQAGAKISEEICRRLRFSNEEVSRIVDMVIVHMDFAKACEMRESTLRRLLKKPDIRDHLELLRVNYLSSQRNLKSYSMCRRKLEQFARNPAAASLIKGEDLIELGYVPGPIFKEMLMAVEDWQLDGVLHTREDALKHIKAAFPIKNRTQS